MNKTAEGCVLILVVVEIGLGAPLIWNFRESGKKVLILVVVEIGLGDGNEQPKAPRTWVS